MISDPIADMFVRLKGAQGARKAKVTLPASRLKETIARVLLQEGYVSGVVRVPGEQGDKLEITLRYNGDTPAISHIARVSRPGARRYSPVAAIPRPLSGYGLAILSTPRGMMSGQAARELGIGGEVIATVW